MCGARTKTKDAFFERTGHGNCGVAQQLTTVDYQFFYSNLFFQNSNQRFFFLIRVKNCPTVVSIHDGGAENPDGSKARPSKCVKGSNV
jgi:hypothetical protein